MTPKDDTHIVLWPLHAYMCMYTCIYIHEHTHLQIWDTVLNLKLLEKQLQASMCHI